MYAKASPFSPALAAMLVRAQVLSLLSEPKERLNELEGSTQVAKWSISLDKILHCNGSLLVASFGFA